MTADASGDRIVRIPGGDLHVARDGPSDAPTVVLLHGLGGAVARWDPVLPALRDLHVVPDVRPDSYRAHNRTFPAFAEVEPRSTR